MLSKAKRLTVKDIEALSHGTSVFSTLVSLRMLKASELKFGVAVSKKVAKTAVKRNRIRRRTYAIVRKLEKSITVKAFVLLMPKQDFYDGDRELLEKVVLDLFKKAQLI